MSESLPSIISMAFSFNLKLKRPGVLVMGTANSRGTYKDDSYQNDVTLGARLQTLPNGNAIRTVFPPQVPVAAFEDQAGYINFDGGWANATQGISLMISKVVALGGKVVAGKRVNQLVRQDGKTTGVQCTDSTVFEAKVVVIATGSWSASTFLDLGLDQNCLATGCVNSHYAPVI